MPLLLLARIWLWRARPALTALAVLALLAAGTRAVTAPPDRGTAIVVTARDVPAGHALTRADLRLAATTTPPGEAATDLGGLVGRSPAVALPAGLPVVPSLLSGERFEVEPPAGTVVLPVEVDAAALLRAGDRVDLLAPGCGADDVLARAALVVDQPDDRSVLVAVAPAEATTVVGLRAECSLAAVVVT